MYPFINPYIHACMHSFHSVLLRSLPFLHFFIHSFSKSSISCHFTPFQLSFHSKHFSVCIYVYMSMIWLSITSRCWFTPTVTDKTLPVDSFVAMTLCYFRNVHPASCGDYWSTLFQITATSKPSITYSLPLPRGPDLAHSCSHTFATQDYFRMRVNAKHGVRQRMHVTS